MKHSSPQITYYYKHREEILRKKKEKYRSNPEIQKQRSKINYQKNRQKYLDYIKAYNKKHYKPRGKKVLSFNNLENVHQIVNKSEVSDLQGLSGLSES
jgi:hypothetical protein